jgi:hypothetical protein
VLETAEVRWFFEGSLPGELLSGYQAASIPGVQEQRTDWYLVGAHRPDLGIKVRDGAWLDVKRRTGVEPDRAFDATMRGDVEHWAKWSFPLAADPVEEVPEWRRVDKRRWIRRYDLGGPGPATAVPFEQVVDSGCSAELSDVLVDGTLSWSLGFEAFGSPDALGSALTAGVSTFLADTPELAAAAFMQTDSRSYPSWLADV